MEKKEHPTYDFARIVDDLLCWFEKEKRELRWRTNPIPYYVWVSEIMLQQTRVEAVKSYFDCFMEELPAIEDLAKASDERLMKLWEGLGYYSRVRNLKKAAVCVMEEYGGELPSRYEELMKLPGIGSYTAGAISSIAYGHSVPAVDGNVLRVTMRLSGCYDDITKSGVKTRLERELRQMMQEKFGEPGGVNAGNFNQAMMELGATVCIPNGKPLCEKCPVSNYCIAKEKDIVMELPIKPAKKARRIEKKTILVLKKDGKIALHKRPDKGLLAGLWEFPNLDEKLSLPQMERFLKEQGIFEYEMQLLGEAKHIFSHVEWHMLGYGIDVSKTETIKEQFPEFVWVKIEELEEQYALPTAFSAFRNQL